MRLLPVLYLFLFRNKSSFRMSSKSAVQQLDDLIADIETSVKNYTPKNIASPAVPVPASSSKKAQPKAAPKADESKVDVINVNSVDLRVGIIRKVAKHETAEKLYCEEIDVGEDVPRQIASGLVPYYTLEQMQDRKLIVVCNLKPRNLVGFKSHGMVLCASKVNEAGENVVEFVDPPAGSKPGDRILGLGLTNEPLTVSKADKLKAFDLVAPDLKVNDQGVAYWREHKLVTAVGEECTAPTVRDAHIH